MAHQTRTRADLAAWGANPTVTAAEMDHLDEKGEESINGDEGGTWAPSAVITIGGSGVTITGQSRFDDVRNVLINAAGAFASNADCEFNALLDITSTGSFHIDPAASASAEGLFGFLGPVEFQGGSAVEVKSTATFTFETGSNFDIDSGSNISWLIAGGAITLETGSALTAEAGSDVFLEGDSVLSGVMVKSGTTGRIRNRALGLPANNTNWTADVTADYWLYTQTTTTPRTITLRRTSAPTPLAGDEMHIRMLMLAASGTITLTNETSGTDVGVFTSTGGGGANVTLIYDGSDWRAGLFSHWGSVTATVGAAF